MMTDSHIRKLSTSKVEFYDFEEILGNCTHIEVLGEGLEGLVIHAKPDGSVIIYKLKFFIPSYVCLREMLKNLNMKDPQRDFGRNQMCALVGT